ncbi:hypothetical protein [Tellurirhabdus bombi]|uniref:hypothetical protein n=1 Tax=Tellurirhabdus bombi TaxID=2907205 RepID=UPI001F225608|nr:hypothetical protein [Tellurirhabdus bombi]
MSYSPNFDAKAYPGRVIHYSEDLAVPMAGGLLAGHVFANYLRRVGTYSKGTILLGTGIHHRIHYPFEAPYAGLSMITSVPLIVKATYSLGPKTQLSTQLSYSLAGLVTRLPWHNTYSLPEVGSQFKALYQNDTQLASGHRLRQVSWTWAIDHQISRRASLGLTYQFDLLRYPHPRPLASWSNSLQLNSSFNF